MANYWTKRNVGILRKLKNGCQQCINGIKTTVYTNRYMQANTKQDE